MNLKLGNRILAAELQRRMRENVNRSISFRDYMDICLYHEPEGYYRNGTTKIGPEGDFYTSSSIGTIMGEILADYLVKTWESSEERTIPVTLVEWGGGNGRLGLHILDQIRQISTDLYDRLSYIMIESSAFHRSLQAETLKGHLKHVSWVSDEVWLSSGRKRGTVVLANELLDAFAVHRIRSVKGLLEENWVSFDEENDIFTEVWLPLNNSEISTYIADQEIILREGQIIEINLDSGRWINCISAVIEQGQLIVIDYGDVAEELYAEHRMRGTLMCYRKHQAYDDPYRYVGEQDITAHVNFTACKRAGEESGFTDIHLQTQRQFLVEQGILNKLTDTLGSDPFSAEAKRNRTIRQLLISDSMSELFKIFCANKR